uniref:Prickle-like protein 2 n=1 Tax=Steinernema glaseri TaxID=37863 RepID=A0A1I7ZJN0_9BILA
MTASVGSLTPKIFQLEQKSQHVLSHDFGAGSPCLKCNCEGLDLHYWRKLCKRCRCRMDEHDIQLAEDHDGGRGIIGRLFDHRSSFSSQEEMRSITERSASLNLGPRYDPSHKNNANISNDICDTESTIHNSVSEASVESQRAASISSSRLSNHRATNNYTWTPSADANLTLKYFGCLPESERPIAGTEGEINRRQKLAYQLPVHDCDAQAAVSITSPEDVQLHSKFVEKVKRDVVGIGQVIECNAPPQSTAQGTQTEAANVSNQPCRWDSCGSHMKHGDVGVVTDHGQRNEVWHPNCFRCATCEQLLVDMLYFFKDNEYYCGRHYAEKMYPRCFGCDELIFANEYTLAEEKTWHFEHFSCFGCDLQLGGHRYLVKNEHPYCINCYMNKFARVCNTCRNKIGPEMQRVSHKDMNWHSDPKCFRCKQCLKSLLHEKFLVKNEETFCSVDCKNKCFSA